MPPEDHLAMVAVWLEILDAEGVPTEGFEPAYKAEMNRRVELKRQGGKDLPPMTADDLAARWREIRDINAQIDGFGRLLPENAAGACVRCFGTTWERMPDGSVRHGCSHVPLTDEEERAMQENRERDAALARDGVEFMREALKKVGAPKPPTDRPAPVHKPADRFLVCGGCRRKVNTTFMRFEPGDACGDLLNRGTHEGEPKLCGGTFEAVS